MSTFYNLLAPPEVIRDIRMAIILTIRKLEGETELGFLEEIMNEAEF